MSGLRQFNDKLFALDDGTGFIYKINGGNAKVFDEHNNFGNADALFADDKHFYIYNYTKYNKHMKEDNMSYSIVKYNYKNRNITKIYDISIVFDPILKKREI